MLPKYQPNLHPELIFVHKQQPSSPTIQKHLVALLALSMVVTRKEVKVLVDDVSAFLDQILDWCLASAADGLGIQTACHILASVVNKHADGE